METTCVRKDSALIGIEHNITLLQQQVWNVLFAFASIRIDHPSVHKIPIVTLQKFIPAVSNRKHLERAVIDLVNRPLRIDVFRKTGRHSNESFPLLSEARFKSGICSYQFPEELRQRISASSTGVEIDLMIQKHYRGGSYGWFLYELCLDVETTGTTGWISLPELRGYLGISEDRYPLFKDLHKRVIKPAVKDVNTQTDLSITHEFKRKGKKITAICFGVDVTPGRQERALSIKDTYVEVNMDAIRPQEFKSGPSQNRLPDTSLKKKIFQQVLDHLKANSESYAALSPYYQAQLKLEVYNNYISAQVELADMFSDSDELADSFFQQQVSDREKRVAALKEDPEIMASKDMAQALKDAEGRIKTKGDEEQIIIQAMEDARERARIQLESEESRTRRDIEAMAAAGRRAEQRLEVAQQREKDENNAAIREARRRGIERLKHLLA